MSNSILNFLIWTFSALLIILVFVNLVYSIVTRYTEHQEIMESQRKIQKAMDYTMRPFEATGFSLKRMEDDRIMISFTRENPNDKDRFYVTDVILSPEDFNYVSNFFKKKQDAKN